MRTRFVYSMYVHMYVSHVRISSVAKMWLSLYNGYSTFCISVKDPVSVFSYPSMEIRRACTAVSLQVLVRTMVAAREFDRYY